MTLPAPPPTLGQLREDCAGCRPVLLGGGGELKTRANANGHRWGPIAATFSSRGARPGAKPRGGTRPLLSPWTFPTRLASQRPAPSALAASGTRLGPGRQKRHLVPRWNWAPSAQPAPSGEACSPPFCPGPPLAGPPFRGLSAGPDRSTSPFVSAEPFPRYFFFPGRRRMGRGGGGRPRPGTGSPS